MSYNPIVFSVELRPNQSLSHFALAWLVGCLTLIIISLGLVFYLIGAWPISGFMGIELMALLMLLHFNRRRSQVIERITIKSNLLCLEKINPAGKHDIWNCPRAWARLQLAGHNEQLQFLSSGQTIPFGNFLTATERLDLFSELQRFLRTFASQDRSGVI